MKTLGCSVDEARDIIATDKRIDRGEKLFELPEELKAGAKKARQAERHTPEAIHRDRKPDEDKRVIMQLIINSIQKDCDSKIEISNAEREILFSYNGKKYRLTLACPRT